MNVLHLNQSDIHGGAAIAAYRLHQGLRRLNVNSRLLVPEAKLKEETTTVLPPMTLAERALFAMTRRWAPNNTNLLRSRKLLKTPAYQQADVIHLHNLHTGLYFNYLTIPRITREKPTVFTLHDMWSFTGHCAFSYDCQRWQEGCGQCPYPETYPAVQWDNTAIEWLLKQIVYTHSKLTIITPSRWLSALAKKSLLSQFPIHTIPYGIDTQVYRPLDKAASRHQLGLPQDKTILMFGCADLADFRKGMDLLVKVLETLPSPIKRTLVLYAMGKESTALPEIAGIKTIQGGFVEGDAEKVLRYSAADIFLSTTRADNLPLVLQESLACGIPLFSTDVGGVSDLVRDGVTGFTAPIENIKAMAARLLELIQNNELRRNMAEHCRHIAMEEYALEIIARKHKVLYETLLTPP